MNHTPTGLWTIGASVDYLPVKALTLRAGYLFIGFTEKSANCAYTVAGSIGCFGPSFSGKDYTTTTGLGGTGGLAGKSTLGQEIDLRADYTVWTGFKIQGMTAWLIPTKGDTTGKYILQMLLQLLGTKSLAQSPRGATPWGFLFERNAVWVCS